MATPTVSSVEPSDTTKVSACPAHAATVAATVQAPLRVAITKANDAAVVLEPAARPARSAPCTPVARISGVPT